MQQRSSADKKLILKATCAPRAVRPRPLLMHLPCLPPLPREQSWHLDNLARTLGAGLLHLTTTPLPCCPSLASKPRNAETSPTLPHQPFQRIHIGRHALLTLPPNLLTLPPNLLTLPPNLLTLPPNLFTLPPNLLTLPPNRCAPTGRARQPAPPLRRCRLSARDDCTLAASQVPPWCACRGTTQCRDRPTPPDAFMVGFQTSGSTIGHDEVPWWTHNT
eukprot:366443-Chlamydomonas_euryale.AAC.8